MISSHLIHLFLLHPKICKPLIIAFLIFGLFLKNSTGDEVSFYIPEDHEKYALFDSLYQQIDSTRQVFLRLEKKLIRDNAVREDDLAVKGQYFDYLLKNNLSTIDKILEYCNTVKKHYDLQVNYFSELLSTLEDDTRAKCFIFLKSARKKLGSISAILEKYDKKEETGSFIINHGGRNELSDDYDPINDPISDIIGSEGENENPFAGTENTMIKLEIDRSSMEDLQDSTETNSSEQTDLQKEED